MVVVAGYCTFASSSEKQEDCEMRRKTQNVFFTLIYIRLLMYN